MKISEIKKSIKNWNDIRLNPKSNQTQIISLLNQGSCFTVKKEEYDKWSREAQHIHVYIGVHIDEDQTEKLKLFLIDSESDKNKILDSTFILDKKYTHGIELNLELNCGISSNEITDKEALIRFFHWKIFINQWMDNIIKTEKDFFQLIIIPFSDYTNLFEAGANKVIHFFGLKPIEGEIGRPEFDIEIIVNDTSFSVSNNNSYDISVPRPPFPKADDKKERDDIIKSDYKLLECTI
jgi:hypothetical protein